MPTEIKYPGITVDLSNVDGNAFAVLIKVKRALIEGDVSKDDVAIFIAEATSGDYDHMLQTCMEWVNVK